MFLLVAHPTKTHHQEVYIFRGLSPELRYICCDGSVHAVFFVSSRLDVLTDMDPSTFWVLVLWHPKHSAKKKPKLDVWEDFLIHKRRIWAIVQTPVYFESLLDSLLSRIAGTGWDRQCAHLCRGGHTPRGLGAHAPRKYSDEVPLSCNVVGTDRLEGPEPENRESKRLLLESSMVTMAKPLDIHDLNEPQKHKVI